MEKIDLAGMARQKVGPGPKRVVVLRPIQARQGAVMDFERAVVAALGNVQKQAGELILPAVAPVRVSVIVDADGAEVGRLQNAIGIIRSLLLAAVAGLAADAVIDRIFSNEEARHRKRLIEQVDSRLGIDLQYIVQREDLADALVLAARRSVNEISGVTDELARRVERAVLDAVLSGVSSSALAKTLTESFGWAKARARLIARDQIGRLNGDLNRLRQTQLGMVIYRWATALDERVRGNPEGLYPRARPSHYEREGKTYRWDRPPEGGHPGEAILCRCVGMAILEF